MPFYFPSHSHSAPTNDNNNNEHFILPSFLSLPFFSTQDFAATAAAEMLWQWWSVLHTHTCTHTHKLSDQAYGGGGGIDGFVSVLMNNSYGQVRDTSTLIKNNILFFFSSQRILLVLLLLLVLPLLFSLSRHVCLCGGAGFCFVLRYIVSM